MKKLLVNLSKMSEFVDVFPTELELTNTPEDHVCPVENCNSVFKKSPHLTMHLAKHHKIGKLGLLTKQCNSRFFCPVQKCTYNKSTADCKSFSQNRLLKQHYMKVHGQKKYECVKCDTKFSIQSIYKRHLNECGNMFYCEACGWEYNNKGSLVLHLSRKHPDLHRLYKQNKYKLCNTSTSKTSQSIDDLNSKKLPIFRNVDTSVISQAFHAVISDTGQNDFMLNHAEANGIQQIHSDIITEEHVIQGSDELSVKTGVKNEVFRLNECENGAILSLGVVDSTKKQICSKNPGNFVSCLSSNGVYSVKADENIINTASSGVMNYILIPAGSVYPNVFSVADNNVIAKEKVAKRGRKRVRQGVKKACAAKHSKKSCKVKESKKKQLIVQESAISTDESSLSSFNQDRFTQTTLKTVIKAKDCDTQRFNVETQTSTAGAKPKHKIKIDKSTNLSYDNNKRTFATQTHRSILNKSKKDQPNCDRVVKDCNRSIAEKQPNKSKAKQYNKLSKLALQNFDLSVKTATFTSSFSVSNGSDVNIYDTKHFNVEKKDSEVQTVLPPCLTEINRTAIEKSIAFCDLGAVSTPTNFDSTDLSMQFTYRDLMDDKSNVGTSTTIETQTALDELLYSNRWKPDSILFSELICLSDIQTQTTWPTDGKNINNGLHFDDDCLNPEPIDDTPEYPDCENALISTETQTNENIFDFPIKIPLHEETRNESPDFSFKETQTCDCFTDSINFDYDFDNLHSGSFSSSNSHSKNCCRGLLNRKSDVLLSCTSSETQTYSRKDSIVSKNLSIDSS